MQNRSISVDEFTTPSPVVIEAEAPIIEAIELMEAYTFRHVPVVDQEGKAIGILSDRDCKVVSSFDVLEALKVKDLMTPEPYMVPFDTPLEEVALVMSKYKWGSVLVNYPQDAFGIFTSTDALNALIEVLRGEASPEMRVAPPALEA